MEMCGQHITPVTYLQGYNFHQTGNWVGSRAGLYVAKRKVPSG